MSLKETAYYNPKYKEICIGKYRHIFENWEEINPEIRHQLELLCLVKCARYTIKRWLPLNWETKYVDSEIVIETGLDYFFDMPNNPVIEHSIAEFFDTDDAKYYKWTYQFNKYGWYVKTEKKTKLHNKEYVIYYKIRRVIIEVSNRG